MPDLHVLAGPNGVGKTTGYDFIIPKGIGYINADIIAKEIKEKAGGLNVQDIANAEASKFFFERISKRETFGFETNLSDLDTYKTLQAVQNSGYKIMIYFLGTDDVETCVDRVMLRVQQGGHFVSPEVVKQRYVNGLALLKYYRDLPDALVLIDNLEGNLLPQAEIQKGKTVFLAKECQPWALSIVNAEKKVVKDISPDTIEEIRRRYKKGRGI